MTGPAQPIEWYLARDNKQYGPLSDIELMKLAEMRHLRDQDLVWRAGFTDWTPAPVAFPQSFAPLPEPPLVDEPPPTAVEPTAAPAAAFSPQPHEAEPSGSPETETELFHSAASAADHLSAEAPGPLQSPVLTQSPTAMTNIASSARPDPIEEHRADHAPQQQPAAKIETLAEYRTRVSARLDAATTQPLHDPASYPATNPGAGMLRAVADAEPINAGQERSRSTARRMWIAPADPEPTPQPIAPQHQLRIDPAPITRPQGLQQQPMQNFDRGFDARAIEPAQTSESQGFAPTLTPHHVFAERPSQFRPEPQRQGSGLDTGAMSRSAPAAVNASRYEDDELEEESPRRPRRIWGLITILVLLAAMVGGTWIAFMHPQLLKQSMRTLGFVSSSGEDEPTSSSLTSRQQAVAVAKPLTAAILQEFPDTTGAIDDILQKGRLWNVVREAFPEWYEERVREAAKMVVEKKPDDAVTKHLIDSLISLRRKNADHAFLASLPALEQVARTFRDSLELLAKHSHVACYSLISNGEGTRGMVTLFRDPIYSPTLQAGLAAVFKAVADGRSNPRTNLPARRNDYDLLTRELQALGWKEQDINLFSDSEALAKTPPEQVCRMVREWFTAHLAIGDNDVRQRLLIESIRPVVSG